jgi:hypothetical protein
MFITMQGLCGLINANMSLSTAVCEECWIDWGARISDVTIIVYNDNTSFGSYQTLSPRQIELFKKGTFTLEEAIKVVKEMQERGW